MDRLPTLRPHSYDGHAGTVADASARERLLATALLDLAGADDDRTPPQYLQTLVAHVSRLLPIEAPPGPRPDATGQHVTKQRADGHHATGQSAAGPETTVPPAEDAFVRTSPAPAAPLAGTRGATVPEHGFPPASPPTGYSATAPRVAVTLAGPPVVTAVSDQRASALWKAEQQSGEGPTHDCLAGGFAGGLTLGTGEHRWPRFGPHALALGVGRVSALPLTDLENERPLGALILYHHSAPLVPHSLFVPQALADAAALRLFHHRVRHRMHHLERALTSRIDIEQAKGMLAERWGCTPDAAFDRLRRYARSHSRGLHELARHIVDGTETSPEFRTPPDPG
ncbi:ANTAR domain-containing protein [Streptomyces sp. NPDC003077]|uniref:ANTAR domain-containing protein n=1 Tax=Streptomyces sp. NPDC003077 TaxID=3154443 RepID=UPI0033B3D963